MFSLAAPLLALMVVASGCTQKTGLSDDPKQVLTDYISKSFAVRSIEDRREMLQFLGGEAQSRLAAWSEEQFREAFVESKRQFIKFRIQEIKPSTENETSITYELTYLDQNKGEDAKITQKKLALIRKTSGKWLIAEVRSLKELIEFQNELSLP